MKCRTHPWLGILLLSSCVTVHPLGNATLMLKPEVGYRSQAEVHLYHKEDINHLVIKLCNTSDQELGISRDIPQSELDKPIVFSGLRTNTTYRVRASAYATEGTTECISNTAASFVDVEVTSDDRPDIQPLKVILVEILFSCEGTGTLDVTPGSFFTTEPTRMYFLVRGLVSTLAGTGVAGAQDGPASEATFNEPQGIAVDPQGNIIVVDTVNSRIRKISPEGVVSTIAGPDASFAHIISAAVDASGNVYVTDFDRQDIKKIDSNGEISIFAGGSYGSQDGIGTAAKFNAPWGITIDKAGWLYVSEFGGNRVRKISPTRVVSTLGGSGFLNNPCGIALDSKNNVYAANYGGKNVVKITPEGVSSVFAGTGNYTPIINGPALSATFAYPEGIAVDILDNVYVADTSNNLIRKITPEGMVSTVAGSTYGFQDGLGSAARFGAHNGMAFDALGNLLIADRYNNRVRIVR